MKFVAPIDPMSPATPAGSNSAGDNGQTPKKWTCGPLVYTAGGLVALFCFLLWGDFGLNMKDRGVTPMMQLMLDQHHVPAVMVGVILSTLPSIVLLIIVPVISYKSDRHRGRLGRRIPFLLGLAPITFLSMAVLGLSPFFGEKLNLLLGSISPGSTMCTVIIIAVGWIVFEICSMSTLPIYNGLVADVVPQSMTGRFYALFRMVSLIDAIIFNYFLLGHAEQHFTLMFVGLGGFYLLTFLLMGWKVKEGPQPPPPPTAEAHPGAQAFGRLAGAKRYLKECFSLPYYRWVLLSISMIWVVPVPIGLYYILFAKSVGMEVATLGKLASLQLTLSLLFAFPAGWLADRFHPLRLTLIAFGLVVAACIAAFFLVRDAFSFGIAYVGIGTLWGAVMTCTSSLPARLYPAKSFATLESGKGILQAALTMVVGPACGFSIDLVGGDYRCIYIWVAVMGLGALYCFTQVYRGFIAFGGPNNYVAPKLS